MDKTKKVSELVRGDVIVQDGVRFVVKETENLPNGKTAILFEDMPTTEENMAAYGKLLKLMKVLGDRHLLEINEETEEGA